MRSAPKTIALWVLIVFGALIAYEHLRTATEPRQAFNYRTLMQALDSGQVQKDSLVFNQVSGTIAGKFTDEGKKNFGS